MTDIKSIQNAQHYVWGNNSNGWILLQSDGLSVIQEHMPPGNREVLHYHKLSHQFFFVISGTGSFQIDGSSVQLNKQEGVSIPPGTPHCLENAGPEPLHFLVISAPESHGDRIDCDRPITGGSS